LPPRHHQVRSQPAGQRHRCRKHPGPDLAAELLDLTWHFGELDDLGVLFAVLLVPDRP
jgi:hypothetical protein